jgi:hypothetical protein
MEGIAIAPEAVSLQSLMVTVSPTTSYFKGSPLTSLTAPNSNITAAAKVEIESCFIMPLKAEFSQSCGKIARGVSNPVLAAKAQLPRTFAAGKIEIKRFFNWGIG